MPLARQLTKLFCVTNSILDHLKEKKKKLVEKPAPSQAPKDEITWHIFILFKINKFSHPLQFACAFKTLYVGHRVITSTPR